MENPSIPSSPEAIRFPLPRSLCSKSNEPITYFPPLKLGHSRDSLPPVLFPLVPTQQITQKDSDCLGASLDSLPIDGGAKELPNPRDSWSYWTGGKARLGKLHISEQIRKEDPPDAPPDAHQAADEKPDVDLAEFGPVKLGSGARLVPDFTGPKSPEEHSQLPSNQHGQVKKAQLSGLDASEKIDKPQSTLPVALALALQPKSNRREFHLASAVRHSPSHKHNPLHPMNESPASANNSTYGRGSLQRECSHSISNQRSYSLTMNSYPPFRPAQQSRTSGRQLRTFLLQGSDTFANGRQVHRVKPDPHPVPDPLQKNNSLQNSPSGVTHSRASEKHLLQNSSGRSSSNKHNQYYKASQPAMLYTNSYQPPHGTLSTSKRYNTRSLRSNGSINYSYPRTYSDPPRYKRRSTSSGSIHSSTGYGDRFAAVGNGGNGPCSYDASGGAMRKMSGGNRKTVPKDFQDHLEMHSEVALDAKLPQANEGAHIVNRRPSIQSQSPHRSNFFIPDRPTASPVRNSSCQSTSEQCNEMSSLNNDMSPSSRKNSGMGLDGEVKDNGLATGYTYSDMTSPSGGEATEETCLDNVEFTTTVDAASRPYTPDQFVAEVGLTHHNNTTTKHLSKNSAGSRGSIRNARRRSVSSAASIYAVSKSLSGHERNVLQKQRPRLSIWPNLNPIAKRSWDVGGGIPSPSPASATTTVGLGIIDTFRERKKVAKELEDAVTHLHTATTCAGPTRGIIRENNSPPAGIRPDVYQPGASESRLNSLAREGRAKYEATNREIRLYIAAQNGSERARGIDALSPTDYQSPTNFENHKNSENPSAVKPDSTSQPETAKVTAETTEEPQVTDAGAAGIKSPTPAPGYIYISTVYHEGQRIVEKIWERGIGGRFANLGSKQNNTARNLRYGSAGKKVKVYMKGARSESLTVLEKIGKNLGIRKGKAPTPVEQTEVDSSESDPFGIGICGAVDVTEGREVMEGSSESNETGFDHESPQSVWKDFEEGELADPVKLKLEGEGSKKYWSSRDEVDLKKTWWGRVRNLVKK